MRYKPGLRLKFNLAVAPFVATVTVAILWADYRHEVAAVMASHSLHSVVVGTTATTGPIDPATLPEAVARRSLRLHVAYGVILLALLAVGVNAALHAFVLRPIDRIRDHVVKMQRGQWRGALEPAGDDEVGRLFAAFQLLGLEIDALVSQLLQAERLSMIALLSKRLESDLEPELRHVAEIAARLHRHGNGSERAHGEELARSAAAMLAALRGLDRPFDRRHVRAEWARRAAAREEHAT